MNTATDCTFESFVRVPSGARPYRLCRAFARSVADGPRVLLLHGPTGTGKSHLLHAVERGIRGQRPGARIVTMMAGDLAHIFVEAVRADRTVDLETSYGNVDLLVVDDLQALMMKLATQEALGASLGRVVSNGAILIGAATAPPRALAPLRAAIEGRWPVRQCVVNPATVRETRVILRTLAARESVSISASMVARVARRMRGDVRRAVGALNQLQAESTLSAGRAGLPWMEECGVQTGW